MKHHENVSLRSAIVSGHLRELNLPGCDILKEYYFELLISLYTKFDHVSHGLCFIIKNYLKKY